VRKLAVLAVLLLLGFFVLSHLRNLGNLSGKGETEPQRKEVLRFALVSDSENDNEKLGKALTGAKSSGASFVIGLGDWTKLGMVDDLIAAKKVFDESGLKYYVTAGDRDLWDSRNGGNAAPSNFNSVFGKSTHVINSDGMSLIIVDNADIYKGISDADWEILKQELESERVSDKELVFVMSHKTPYHPQSEHLMGSESENVARQAKDYLDLLETSKVDGFFSGDLHFFARFNSPNGVKITTIGAVGAERNFQGPRFAIVSVFEDYSWEIEDVEIR
jgi:predicted phosphodiesterase